MRQSGLWHPRLASLVAGMYHGEHLVLADPGLPVPRPVEVVDLVFARGEPRLVAVLRAVLADLVVEQATLARELADATLVDDVRAHLGDIPLVWVDHERLKAVAATARAVVRTGEDTPYANIVLSAGVPF